MPLQLQSDEIKDGDSGSLNLLHGSSAAGLPTPHHHTQAKQRRIAKPTALPSQAANPAVAAAIDVPPLSPSDRRSSTLTRKSSMNDRFIKAHVAGDVVAEPIARPQSAAPSGTPPSRRISDPSGRSPITSLDGAHDGVTPYSSNLTPPSQAVGIVRRRSFDESLMTLRGGCVARRDRPSPGGGSAHSSSHAARKEGWEENAEAGGCAEGEMARASWQLHGSSDGIPGPMRQGGGAQVGDRCPVPPGESSDAASQQERGSGQLSITLALQPAVVTPQRHRRSSGSGPRKSVAGADAIPSPRPPSAVMRAAAASVEKAVAAAAKSKAAAAAAGLAAAASAAASQQADLASAAAAEEQQAEAAAAAVAEATAAAQAAADAQAAAQAAAQLPDPARYRRQHSMSSLPSPETHGNAATDGIVRRSSGALNAGSGAGGVDISMADIPPPHRSHRGSRLPAVPGSGQVEEPSSLSSRSSGAGEHRGSMSSLDPFGGAAPPFPNNSLPSLTPLGALQALKRHISSSGVPIRAGHAAAAAADGGPTIVVSVAEFSAMQMQLRSMESQQRRLNDALKALLESRHAITTLQERVRTLESQARTQALVADAPQSWRPTLQQVAHIQPSQQQLRSRSMSPPYIRSSSSEGLSPLHHQAPHSLLPLQPTVSPRLPPQQQQQQAGGLPAARRALSGVRLSMVRVCVTGLDVLPLRCAAGIGLSLEVQGSQPLDMDAAYADALQSNRGSMHLMRLLAKTGCVWNELTQGTANTLLGAFIGYVNDHTHGSMLPKILPWLWRLADEETNRFEAPTELANGLLQALTAVTATCSDPQLVDKISMLLATLRAHWTIGSRRASAAGDPRRPKPTSPPPLTIIPPATQPASHPQRQPLPGVLQHPQTPTPAEPQPGPAHTQPHHASGIPGAPAHSPSYSPLYSPVSNPAAAAAAGGRQVLLQPMPSREPDVSGVGGRGGG
ncbi:MAG: hypothetical protein WDW38_001610 [Sanguina aurantia]